MYICMYVYKKKLNSVIPDSMIVNVWKFKSSQYRSVSQLKISADIHINVSRFSYPFHLWIFIFCFFLSNLPHLNFFHIGIRKCSSHAMNNNVFLASRITECTTCIFPTQSQHETCVRYFDISHISKSCRWFTRYPYMHPQSSHCDYLIALILYYIY